MNPAISKPMLFSAPMIKALLDGSKSQTRRVVKPQPSELFTPSKCELYAPSIDGKNGMLKPGPEQFGCYDVNGEDEGYKCPHPVNSEIWVRETFKWVHERPHCVYRADNPKTKSGEIDHAFGPWRPAIFMRKEYSRITLLVEVVRVERLNDISEADAKSEGVVVKPSAAIASRVCNGTPGPAQFEYYALWESINGKGSWALNPWVWVYQFRRIKP